MDTEDTYPAPEPIEVGSMPPVPGPPAGPGVPRVAIIAGAVALGLVLIGLVRSISARSAGATEEAEETGGEE